MKRKELKIRLSFGQWLNQPAQILRFQKILYFGPIEARGAVAHADYIRHGSPAFCCLIFFICTLDNKTLIRTVEIIKAERVQRTINP